VPSHVGGDDLVPFGQVFNTTRLSQAIGTPIVEWHDLKKPDSEIKDDIGCWDIWEASQYDEDRPRGSWLTSKLMLGLHAASQLASDEVK
jgi:hypothetical protein